MTKTVAYIRVSSKDQNEDRQMMALNKVNVPVKNIYMDKLSGKDFNRPQYKKLVANWLEAARTVLIGFVIFMIPVIGQGAITVIAVFREGLSDFNKP